MSRLAVLVSGEGTNFEALAQAGREGRLPGAELGLVLADRPCRALERAERWGVPARLLPRRGGKAPPDEEILTVLDGLGITHLVLAGYLSRLGRRVVRSYEGRALNLHPSLLPAFPGLDAIGQALAHGVKVTGVTVHLVDEHLDTGPIVWQEAIHIRPEETHQSLRERLAPLEHRGLIAAVRWMVEGRIALTGRTTRILEGES